MLIFYIIFGCLIFALSGLIIQFNRLAIYRRRIIRNLADSQQKNKQQCDQHNNQQSPFVLSKKQEQQIKQCFLKGTKIKQCIERL